MFWRRKHCEQDLERELHSGLELEAAEQQENGLSPEEARYAARRAFGNTTFLKEETREMWGWVFLEVFWQDLRYALRAMAHSPAFTTVAILTLGLGIGANTTIFSFIDAFFLRPLPVKEPSRLVAIYGSPPSGFCYPEYAHFRDNATVFSGLAAHYSTAPLNIVADGDSKESTGAVVSANYFSVLGIEPFVGRFFSAEEDAVPDRDFVAVISYRLWRNRFAGSSSIVGKQIRINGSPFSIIGVAPKEFRGVLMGMPDDVWIPAMTLHVGWRGCDGFQFDCRRLDLIGRLAPARQLAEAQAQIFTLAGQLAAAHPVTNRGRSTKLEVAIGPRPGDRKYFSDQSKLLGTVAGILLLIACANVAGLLLARGSARAGEISLRLSIGASRFRLIRQFLTESVLLSAFGGLLGLLVSIWAKSRLLGFYSTNTEGTASYYDLSLDPHILAYPIALSSLVGLLIGVLPAIRSTRQDLIAAVKERAQPVTSRRGILRAALVAGQIALCISLLVSAGLLVRSAANIRQGANFDADHVALLRLRPGLVQYSPTKAQAFQQEVIRRLENLPRVQSVTLARGQGLAWLGCCEFRIALPGQRPARPEDALRVDGHSIAPRYFETLRIPLLEGRDFNGRDRAGSQAVAIINQTLARRLWPQESPVGRSLFVDNRLYEVVGVVKDARLRNAVEGPLPFLYTAYWQDDQQTDSRMCIRVAGDAAAMLPLIRHEIGVIDPRVPISEDMAMTRQVDAFFMPVRLSSSVTTCAGALALFLSAIGLYGLLAFSVNLRTREIGIRMALGALPASVSTLVLKQGMTLALAGAALGLLLSLALARLLAGWLYGVPVMDPVSYLIAVVVLVGVTVVACYLPARRAARIDPMIALRYE